ncbi:MAG: hypothetical protein DRP74_04080 [Candidatus Omnitrophota bacterium]|nr:MAG: hypothetical protein DRP74_04080 [Candidatus Omnitrophota bacterium]
MHYLIILILASLGFFLLFKKFFSKNLKQLETTLSGLKKEYAESFQENLRLNRQNLDLRNNYENTIALYDITKEISKSLESATVFNNFKEQVNKYIKIGDCQFLGKEADLTDYSNYTRFPLEINKVLLGYLLADGIKEEDKLKFEILSQQFLLGVKRSILYHELQELAIRDSLTGVFNRRYYLERLNEELRRSGKFKYNFSCLMIDIDHFKKYNDRYGHLVGDAVLKEVSKRIKENIRQIDFMSRYGGEEFSVILSETDKELAKAAAERIRKAVHEEEIKVYDENLKVTISIGVSTFPEDGKDSITIIDNADTALYRAKELGRNKVVSY